MVATLGFLTIGLFLLLTMTRRLSVLLALVLIPLVTAVAGGFGGQLGEMTLEGLQTVAPVAIMIMFAVLYFSLMVDTGLFDPVIRTIVRWAKGDPTRITVGTALLTILVALDGEGASTFLITVSAMLPIYKRLNMRPLVLAGVIALGAGVMNMIPWGGPTARAMAVLELDSGEVFTPVLPAMLAGIAWVLVAAYLIGRQEHARLRAAGVEVNPAAVSTGSGPGTLAADTTPATGWRLWFNVVLTVVLIVALLAQLLPLSVLFVIAFALALLVNRPSWPQQQRVLERHGYNVVLVTSMIFAAGVFAGILGGTGMITEMSEALVAVLPDALAGALPLLTAVVSMPLSLVFTPDAFYFGVVPVLAETAGAAGTAPAEIGRAAILGQMTVGFPLSPLTASTFILVGMTGVDLGAHQRFIFRWAFATTLVMTVVALLTGAISL